MTADLPAASVVDVARPVRPAHSFRSVVLRGLGVVAPPLLTVAILVWVTRTIDEYVLDPLTAAARTVLIWSLSDAQPAEEVRPLQPGGRRGMIDSRPYCRLEDNTWIPQEVYDLVNSGQGDEPLPQTALGYYQRYVELKYLRSYVVIPFFLLAFTLILYLLGKLMAAGVGRIAYSLFEQAIRRLPLVRSVYTAVKQLWSFFVGDLGLKVKRVVAVEYPGRGTWCLGFVMGEAFRDIAVAANEPVVSVLMDTSPVPMNGLVAIVRESELVDLNLTIEEAFEWVMTCGVVVPPARLLEMRAHSPAQGPPKLLESGGPPPQASGA
jgi:uncharacterized membrane protein